MDSNSRLSVPKSSVRRSGDSASVFSNRRRSPQPQEEPRVRADIINRASHQVSFDKKAIFDAASDHECYHVRQYCLRNLPKYDDCKDYNLDKGKAKTLLNAEIDKLTSFAAAEEPPIFSSHNCLYSTKREDFENLSGLADQMSCILTILEHDNSRHGVQIGTVAASHAWDTMISSRTRLRARYARNESHVEGLLPETLPDEEQNQAAFCHLLDYILGVMTWWLVRCADSDFWRTHLVSILAQWAVKMKVILAFGPAQCAESTLSQTSGIIERLKLETEFKDVLIKIGGKERDAGSAQTQTDGCNLYCEEKMSLREPLEAILYNVLGSMKRHMRSGTEADFFEVCTIIHRQTAKSEGISNFLAGQRHGDIAACSDLNRINVCYSMFQLLKQNTHILEVQGKSAPPQSHRQDDVKVTFTAQQDDISLHSSLSLSKMDDVISVLLPLVLMTPDNAANIMVLESATSLWARAEDPIRHFEPPSPRFAMYYTLSTEPWLANSNRDSHGDILDPHIKSLSKSPFRRHMADKTTTEGDAPTNEITKMLTKYSEELEKMRKWTITANEIIVECRTYVLTVELAVIFLVLGGLAIPFSVGDRISGVDPFQMATYTWPLAGFLLVLAKSVYVNSWPWHDFLDRRVVCQTLSDLSDVTGTKPQLILLFLLRNEWDTLLVTRGPYNGMFRRSCDPRDASKNKAKHAQATLHRGLGFSIDIPVDLTTMHAAGFVVMKVRNSSGEHLICIDGRKGGWDSTRQGTRANWMTCFNFNYDALENMSNDGMDEKPHMLERFSFTWTKVLGIYVKPSCFG